MKKVLLSLLSFILLLSVGANPVQAVRDLEVECPDIGTCSVTSPAVPPYKVFDDTDTYYPGSPAVIQYIEVTNTSSTDGYAAIQVDNYVQSSGARFVPADFDFGDSIDINIYRGSVSSANLIYGTLPLTTFRDDGYFTIDALNAGESERYYITAQMKTTMGDSVIDNYYQGGSSEFDLIVGLEVEEIPPSSGGGDGDGGSSGGDSGKAPQCEDPDMFPDAPGNFRITDRTSNSATLAWDPVPGASEYVIFFKDANGNEYSVPSRYVGNNTSYTIRNISGGQWTFEVAAVGGNNNLCSGPRAVITETIPGGQVSGRPIGQGGEVLGVDDEPTPTPTATPEPTEKPGDVAGTTDECVIWKLYIPWILLIAQFVLILGSEYYFRKDKKWTKHYVAVGMTLASIFIFYLVRECQCYDTGSWLVWLCKWYWVVSLLLSLLLKGVSYAFIEEVEESNIPQDKDQEPEVKA